MPLLFQYVPCASKGQTRIRPLSHVDEVWRGLMVAVSCMPQDMGVPDVPDTLSCLQTAPSLPQVPWPQRMLQLCQGCPGYLGILQELLQGLGVALMGGAVALHSLFLVEMFVYTQTLGIQNSFSYQKNPARACSALDGMEEFLRPCFH